LVIEFNPDPTRAWIDPLRAMIVSGNSDSIRACSACANPFGLIIEFNPVPTCAWTDPLRPVIMSGNSNPIHALRVLTHLGWLSDSMT
jgi:hypothetical protein